MNKSVSELQAKIAALEAALAAKSPKPVVEVFEAGNGDRLISVRLGRNPICGPLSKFEKLASMLPEIRAFAKANGCKES